MQYANETVTKVTVFFVAFFLINEISNHSYCSLRTILLIHIAHHYTKGLCKELESDSLWLCYFLSSVSDHIYGLTGDEILNDKSIVAYFGDFNVNLVNTYCFS